MKSLHKMVLSVRDPRWFQGTVLGALLLWGQAHFAFAPSLLPISVTFAGGLLTQWGCSRWVKIPFDPLSPLITCCSLCLLLRADHPGWYLLAVVLAIGSKFVIRAGGRHIFNPANFALVALVGFPGAWVSPGQWGSGPLLLLIFSGCGWWVLSRTARSDVTWAFLAAWAGLLFARAAWLGDPWGIPLRQLQNGSVLLFAFFMISDPKTIPDTRIGRVLFAVGVAWVGGLLQFNTIDPVHYGLFLTLPVFSLLVPLINRRWRGIRFAWHRPKVGACSSSTEALSSFSLNPPPPGERSCASSSSPASRCTP